MATTAPTETAAQRARFRWLLAAIALVAFGVRLWYVLTLARRNPTGGDPFYYHAQANLLADGKGFSEPFTFAQTGRLKPTAFHPPLFSLLLSVPSWFGATSFFAHKVTASLAGTGTVVVLGLVGREVAGRRVGLVAAALAALYPNLWVVDGILMPESLYGLSISVVLLLSWRFRQKPRYRLALGTGAAIGVATLVRGEAILLVPILAAPLALTARLDRRERMRRLAAMAVAVGLVIAPWAVRNAVRFGTPILSVNGDEVIGIANCNKTYYGRLIGFWSLKCYRPMSGSEAERGAARRRRGLRYAREHIERLPYLIVIREGRMWDLYRPWENENFGVIEGRDRNVTRVGQRLLWTMMPFGVIGLVVLHRRRRPLLPLAAQVMVVVITAATAYGAVRFRIPADIVLLVLVAVVIDAAIDAVRRSRARSRRRALRRGSRARLGQVTARS